MGPLKIQKILFSEKYLVKMGPFRKKWDKYSGVSGFEGGHFGPLKFLPPTDGDIGYAPVLAR